MEITVFTKDFKTFLETLREQRYTGRFLVEITMQEGGVRRIEYFEKKRVIDPHKRGT